MTVAGDSIQFELRSGTSWKDPFPMYRLLRDHDPVHLVEPADEHEGFWFLSRFADVLDAVRTHDRARRQHAQRLTFGVRRRPHGNLRVHDDPPFLVVLGRHLQP